jgi:hypothetical protein
VAALEELWPAGFRHIPIRIEQQWMFSGKSFPAFVAAFNRKSTTFRKKGFVLQ